MIAHIAAQTAKLGETAEFYQWLLDLPVSQRINAPKGEIVFLGGNETKFELMENGGAQKINAKGLSIGFAASKLEEKIAMLDSKQISHSGIISPAPGARFALFADLNGCEMQLFEV